MLANEQQQKDIEWIEQLFPDDGRFSNLYAKTREFATFLIKVCPPNRTRTDLLRNLEKLAKQAEQSIEKGLEPEKATKVVSIEAIEE